MLEVKLPDLGEGITEGEIIQFLVEEGEHVSMDQPLVEIQTDKVVAELPSPSAGIVKQIIIPAGEVIQVGTTIMYIETEEKRDDVDRNKRVLASPYTRKIAREHHINLEDVPASDPSGRITEEDVYQYLDEIPFQGIRQRIANKMSKSKLTIPHVTVFEEVDLTKLSILRKELKEKEEPVPSITAFLIKALILALKDYPMFNAELDEGNEKIILKKEYHIGLATDTRDGVLVPVLTDAHKKSIQTMDRELKALTKRAQQGKLNPAQLRGSTFTVSNVGPLGGGLYATPIINYPETALIAFHQMKKRPVVNEQDDIVIREIMTLSFVFDHRVADGASAIRFLKRFSSLIEQPYKLMLELI